MTSTEVPLSERMELAAAEVTLDGKPAKVCGYRNRFAVVRQSGSALAVEYAWPTVKFVVDNRKGAFQS